ncbi:MAG: hypothetical protein ACRDO2_05345 [Nocardioidaceae bacterium]
MINKIALAGAAALATIAGAGMASAVSAGGDSAQAGGSDSVGSAASVTAFRCDGGSQKAVYNRIVNQPFVFGEGGTVGVPGAGLGLTGPVRGADTLSVTFSAETQLRGNASNDQFDWAELEVLLDGVPLQPAGPPGSPMAITGSSTYAMNAAQFCGKIREGQHTIRVVSRIVDNGNDDTLSTWLDDYVLRVEVSD